MRCTEPPFASGDLPWSFWFSFVSSWRSVSFVVRQRDHSMSFRRDKKKVRKWHTFLDKHRNELIAFGIPLTVLDDERRWEHFLYEGYYTPPGSAEPIIELNRLVDPMDRQEMERLCCLLEEEGLDSPSYVLVNRLQYL